MGGLYGFMAAHSDLRHLIRIKKTGQTRWLNRKIKKITDPPHCQLCKQPRRPEPGAPWHRPRGRGKAVSRGAQQRTGARVRGLPAYRHRARGDDCSPPLGPRSRAKARAVARGPRCLRWAKAATVRSGAGSLRARRRCRCGARRPGCPEGMPDRQRRRRAPRDSAPAKNRGRAPPHRKPPSRRWD